MLHAGIGDGHEFVAVFIEGILAEPMLKRFEHARDFFELVERSLFLVRQNPIVNVQRSTFALIFLRDVYVVADVHVDAIVIDWIQNFPMKRFCLRGVVMIHFLQAAVGNTHKVFRHSDVDAHPAIRFVVADIFIRPPDARANSFAGGVDEIFPEIVSPPAYPANPRRIRRHRRHAFVEDFNLIFQAFGQLTLKGYPIDVSFPLKFEW